MAQDGVQESPYPMISVPEAIDIVLREACRIRLSSESVSIQDARGRIAAASVVAPRAYPYRRVSLVDGFAVFSRKKTSLRCVGMCTAGDKPLDAKQNTEECYSITTGAYVPDGIDCIVPIEHVRKNGDSIEVLQFPTRSNMRLPGSDISQGQVLVEAGSLISAVEQGLCRQTGIYEIDCLERVKVGILSTGNELEDIPDVNGPMLMEITEKVPNMECQFLGIIRDDEPTRLKEIIRSYPNISAFISTGGVSMGHTDFVHGVFEELGATTHFGRLHMKPGKPTTFCTLQNQLLFGLPGNPVSAAVCSQLLIVPALRLLSHVDASGDVYGESHPEHVERKVLNASVLPYELTAVLTHDYKLDAERPEYMRVILSNENGVWRAKNTGYQRSSRVASLQSATALMVLPIGTSEKPEAKEGDEFLTLLLEDSSIFRRSPISASEHLRDRRPGGVQKAFGMDVVVVGDDALVLSSDEIASALSGSKSGTVRVASRTVVGDIESFKSSILPKEGNDFTLVVTAGLSWQEHSRCLSVLQPHISKAADSIALQLCRGAASSDPNAALFSPLVGSMDGCLLVAVSANGLREGLSNVRGLAKHALRVSRT